MHVICTDFQHECIKDALSYYRAHRTRQQGTLKGNGIVLVIHIVSHGALFALQSELASQSLHRNLLLFFASETKSAATNDVSVLFLMPALVFGGSRAAAELGLAPRATVAISCAAVTEDLISTSNHRSLYRDLPMGRTTHPCLASLTAIATTSVDRSVSRRHARFGSLSPRRRRHSSRRRIVGLHGDSGGCPCWC